MGRPFPVQFCPAGLLLRFIPDTQMDTPKLLDHSRALRGCAQRGRYKTENHVD
jgi:hypothetical protein